MNKKTTGCIINVSQSLQLSFLLFSRSFEFVREPKFYRPELTCLLLWRPSGEPLECYALYKLVLYYYHTLVEKIFLILLVCH